MSPTPVTCPQCAASLPPATRRCEYCGTYFEPAPGTGVATSEVPPPTAAGDPFVLALRSLHKELKGYSGSGSNVTVLVGLVVTLAVPLCSLLWWRLGWLWTLVATAVTALVGFTAIGIHVGRERRVLFDAEYVVRLERLEAEHGLDRTATARIAKEHLPLTSDLREGIERSLRARAPISE